MANLEPLGGLTLLTDLDLTRTPVENLTPLVRLPRLRLVFGASPDAVSALNAARRARHLPEVSPD